MINTKGKEGIARSLGSIVVLACLAGCGGSTSPGGGSAAPAGVRVTANMSITWNSPNHTLDGNCVQNVSGYRLYVGLAPGTYTVTMPVSPTDAACTATTTVNACGAIESCTYTVQDLVGWSPGNWYFTVTATDQDGNESAFSSEVAHAIN